MFITIDLNELEMLLQARLPRNQPLFFLPASRIMSQSISKPAEKTLSRKCWKQLSWVEYPKIVQIILLLPSDWLVMLIKGLSFHVKVRRMGKARERRKSWAIRGGGALKPLGGTQRHKQEWAGFTEVIGKQWTLLL